jgi:K+-sensing histidine kinase KdpD
MGTDRIDLRRIRNNYFFTYPYFAFNFTISGYPVTFVSMLLVAMITSTLAAGPRNNESDKGAGTEDPTTQ